MRPTLIVTFILLIFSGGCPIGGQIYRIDVDSISALGVASKTRYVLSPKMKDVEEDDLQYQEYALYIERALASRGYTKTENPAYADIAIFLGYGISEPETHQETTSSPVYGQTGVSEKKTTGNIGSYGSICKTTNTLLCQDTTTYSDTTTYTPSYGVIGSETKTHTYTNYSKYMSLYALDLNEYRRTKKEKEIWEMTVTSTDSSDDLRRIFPVLVAAATPHIATSTGKKVSIFLNENDKKVMEIKGIQTK